MATVRVQLRRTVPGGRAWNDGPFLFSTTVDNAQLYAYVTVGWYVTTFDRYDDITVTNRPYR